MIPILIVLIVRVAALAVVLAPLVPRLAGEVLGPCVAVPVAPLAVVVSGPMVNRSPVWSVTVVRVVVPPASRD